MFRDRTDAGEQLADRLVELDLEAPVILALPRGGVPVAAVVAARFDAPLDVLVARKVGAPGNPEFGIGAVAEGGIRFADPETLRMLGLDDRDFERRAELAETELERRVRRYRGERPLPDPSGHDLVLVDDGLATGVTAGAALLAAKRLGARRLLLAVPVAASDSARRLTEFADLVVTVLEPEEFGAVGRWYRRFDQTSDDEVLRLLGRGDG